MLKHLHDDDGNIEYMKKLLEVFQRPIAHRGLHGDLIIENSLLAFEHAINAGFGFELDVHMLRDGTIVVHHDYSLKRLSNVDIKLEDIDLAEMKKYPFTGTTQFIPTLQEVLDLTHGQVPILIELKIANSFDSLFTQRLIDLLDSYDHTDQIAIQSFNPYAMKWLREHTNRYLLGQLSSGKLEGQKPHIQFLFKTLLVNHISHPDFVSFDVQYLPSPFVNRARKKGIPIIAWTIADDKRHEIAKKYADQIIFEKIKP